MCSEETKTAATIAAKYLTKYYAQKYIKQEEKSGRWPCHMTDISNIFKKDLGKTLELEGTREYFLKLYHHLRSGLAQLIEKENGRLLLNNYRCKNTEYMNLKHLLVGFSSIENLNSSGYYCLGETKFDLKIDNGFVKATESTLVYSDPYDDDDEYRNKTIALNSVQEKENYFETTERE